MAVISGIPVWREFAVTAPPTEGAGAERHEVLVVGAGPVGLTVALGLARLGRRVTVVTRLHFIAAGSKAICFSKRTLDIWHRLGVAKQMVAKGVIWNVGKVFRGADTTPIYQFDMLPVKDQQMPAFINLQQYHAEEILLNALSLLPNVDIRWGHEVIDIENQEDSVRLTLKTAEAKHYTIETAWLIACDGSRSPVRTLLKLDFEGRAFEDNFLIADIKLREARPSERWFWFDPPFNPGRSALLHKQPDDVWRLDFQLGAEVDREACTRPENVEPLVRGMLGDAIDFTPEWYSLYTFQCRRMARFVHGRVIFAGDSAHLVSPFGARGCNGGIADAENVVWKLDLVLKGEAPERLLESYNDEAIATAEENIRNSTRSTDFMVPKTAAFRYLRDAVLDLAGRHDFARPFVNSGRLSTAISYPQSSLNTPDREGETWAGLAPGSPAVDAPLGDGWLLERLGDRFTLVGFGLDQRAFPGIDLIDVEAHDARTLIIARYDLQPGSAYLIRPDQYVAARWRRPTLEAVLAASAKAQGNAS